MLARLQRLDRGLRMQMRRIANVNEIEIRIREHIIKAAIFLDAGQVHHLAAWPKVALDGAPIPGQLRLIPAANRFDARALKLASGKKMHHAHKSQTYYADPHHFHISFHLLALWHRTIRATCTFLTILTPVC